MCGIIGIASVIPQEKRAWLAIGRDSMKYRGPDDSGEWWSYDGRVGLAHRRLSIMDLSNAGHQPMHDAFDELTIVFNGEIYNFNDLREDLIARGYIFTSRSDTEVILASYREWGTNCLEKFNGMFAFSLYDSRKKIIFLARDRAGQKPLFYYQTREFLRFSSELRALLVDAEMPRVVDHVALDCFLNFGHTPSELSMLKGFNKLPPAHALTFDITSGHSKMWRYWQLPSGPIGETLEMRSHCWMSWMACLKKR